MKNKVFVVLTFLAFVAFMAWSPERREPTAQEIQKFEESENPFTP